MRVRVTFRHIEATASLKEYAETKASRLNKFLLKPTSIEVILSVEGKLRHTAEIIVTDLGEVMTSTETSDDLYAAIDLVLDKAERQAKRFKEKHTVEARRSSVDLP